MIENVILWRSVVGSHIWGMNRPDSDIDYYICYAVDPRDFWLGNIHDHGQMSQTEEEDASDLRDRACHQAITCREYQSYAGENEPDNRDDLQSGYRQRSIDAIKNNCRE